MNIAIDGPSGAGKSTVARILSQKLGIVYLDTGAMYRAIGLKIFRAGLKADEEPAIVGILKETKIEVKTESGIQRIFLDGEDVSDAIRKHEISAYASDVSKIHAVRLAMVELQREIARKTDSVLDGRDIGSFVLKDAEYKFYLTASVEERAKRRFTELKEKGEDCELENIARDIKARDHNDMTRDFAPLVQAKDAVLIDSTNLTIDEVVTKILSYIKEASKKTQKEQVKPEKIKKVKQKKEKPFRRKLWFSFMFLVVRFLLWLPRKILLPAKVIHKERLLKKQKHIVVSNHQSWKDIVHVCLSLPRHRYIIAKEELRKSKFLRFWRKTMGVIFIDREKPSLSAFREIFAVLKCDLALSLFPEGTRNKVNRELQEIKSGSAVFAIKSGAPIIPVMIYGNPKMFHRNYIYVGEPFTLNEFQGVRLTPELTAQADEKVGNAMLKEMQNMDDYVQNKRWKKKNRLAEPQPAVSEPLQPENEETE